MDNKWLPLDTSQARWDEIKFGAEVAKWPRPGTRRLDPRFRMLTVEGAPFPYASSHIFRLSYKQFTAEVLYCRIDLEWVEGPNHLFGTSGISNEGREFTMAIKEYRGSPDPIFGFEGLRYTFVYRKDGGGICRGRGFMSNEFGSPDTSFYDFHVLTSNRWDLEDMQGPIAPTDWTKDPVIGGVRFVPVSECYVTEVQAAPAPLGMAELNGVDSDVIFDNRTTWNDPRFYIEFDIRNHATGGIVVLGKTFNTTQYFGFTGEYAFWNGYLTWMGEELTLDTWIHVRFEWAWSAEDSTYRVFWDGAPKGTQAGALRFNQFDTIGKKGPAFIGNYDLKNLFYATGSPGSEIVLLDMPLIDDACDAGPDLIKGTTTNMALASCP